MTTPLSLLIIEDSADDACLVMHELKKNGYDLDCERVDTPDGMQGALSAREWDIIISDFTMPRFSGMDALQILKDSGIDIPFIIVSGKIGEETAVKAMHSGAHDYILKDNLARLAPAIEREMDEADGRRKRREIDKELAVVNKMLETRVVELVADQRLKDQILIQQSRLAAMGDMLGNIAHHWRQPLNNVALIIQGLNMQFDSGMLTRVEMDSESSKAMEFILQMSKIIDDFRNLFREDKERRGFSINKAVKQAIEMISPTLNSHNIKIDIEGISQDMTITGYQSEYIQVLLNIISNALETALERNIKKPCISIRTAMENARTTLYIRDNCGGIADDVMPKIFDPYFTTRGLHKGTGIGLYMSKVIIEQNMSGNLTACNLDGGAEFRIEV